MSYEILYRYRCEYGDCTHEEVVGEAVGLPSGWLTLAIPDHAMAHVCPMHAAVDHVAEGVRWVPQPTYEPLDRKDEIKEAMAEFFHERAGGTAFKGELAP